MSTKIRSHKPVCRMPRCDQCNEKMVVEHKLTACRTYERIRNKKATPLQNISFNICMSVYTTKFSFLAA